MRIFFSETFRNSPLTPSLHSFFPFFLPPSLPLSFPPFLFNFVSDIGRQTKESGLLVSLFGATVSAQLAVLSDSRASPVSTPPHLKRTSYVEVGTLPVVHVLSGGSISVTTSPSSMESSSPWPYLRISGEFSKGLRT